MCVSVSKWREREGGRERGKVREKDREREREKKRGREGGREGGREKESVREWSDPATIGLSGMCSRLH